MKWILLQFLPALVFAAINVDISATDKKTTTSIELSGLDTEVITNRERSIFKISDTQLKDASGIFSGKRPDDVFVKGPTPWNDLYATNGWKEIERTVTPEISRILMFRADPISLGVEKFVNNSTSTMKYQAGTYRKIYDKVIHSWVGCKLEGQNISYSIDFNDTSSRLAYSAPFGEDHTEFRPVKIGYKSQVIIYLNPGQTVYAELEATKVTMEIEVMYSASLEGDVACNYSKKYKDHHFWRYDIEAVLDAANVSNKKDCSELIKISFYTDIKFVVTDRESNTVLFKAGVRL